MATSYRALTTLTSSSSSSPISVTEFVASLSKIWKPSKCHGLKTFGLAISGGVDSMALAALCAQMQSGAFNSIQSDYLEEKERFKFRAFVVDHGVRSGSAIEAQAVAQVLEKRGIETNVLKIQWPTPDNPAKKPDFESLARKHRYQVIGRACQEHRINSLFLAHHEDDQAETILMRLIGGHKRLGLTGIKSDSDIPECYGMHGVHESGGNVKKRWRARTAPTQRKQNWKHANLVSMQQPIPESGGIRIYRPFLGFGKDRLVATCRAQGIEWFEDLTNQDPTLTSRNAIRHLYKSHSVPTTLTKPALLQLSQRCQEVANAQLAATEKCLSQCKIRRFDTRSGIMDVQFNDMNETTPLPEADKKLVAANILRRIMLFVTPQEHIQTSSLHSTMQRIFPELFPTEDLESRLETSKFTVAGVMFQGSLKYAKREWSITRQPFHRTNKDMMTIPPSKDSAWSEWALYDGRYWIRIQNNTHAPLLIRPYHDIDHSRFRHSFPEKVQRQFNDLLKVIAPEHTRYTLPSIVGRGDDGEERVLALPTLNVGLEETDMLVKWEVRYKKLYTSGLDLPSQLDAVM